MKNRYEIRGDVAVIFLRRKKGPPAETVIDAADLPLVASIKGSWCLGAGYARSNNNTLHSFLLGKKPASELVPDHINRVKTDNRRSNLRWVTRSENTRNRDPLCCYKGTLPSKSDVRDEISKFLAGAKLVNTKIRLVAFEYVLREVLAEKFPGLPFHQEATNCRAA